jgi:TP901 family phage tail tape measure protein
MARENFELAILISLRDAASRGTDRVTSSLREMGKEGRTALRQFESLKDGLKQHLALGGIGIAGLMALRGGVKAAGDFESVMTDLRLAFSEVGKDGVVNLAQLNNQLHQAEQLTVGLGNDLPGTTSDFAEMLTVLRQGGLEAQTIFDGAGKSVAHLAVVTRTVPKDLAKDFAQFGQQFKLKPEEYTQAADLFARIYARSGLGSAELIEGSKYFQLRAGAPLGLTGIQGAETGARLMAAMKKLGLEGSIAGTGTATFFKELADDKKMARLQKETGVTLRIFDQKGEFLGIDNVFKEMEKLGNLDRQTRITALDKLVGSEGAAVGSSITEMGLKGWKDFNSELDKAVSLQESIARKTADYNSKVEALGGTLENLKVTAFSPMLEGLKPLADLANKVAGNIQEFSKTHPVLTRTIGLMTSLGIGSMAVVSGVNAMTTAWRLWRIMATVGAGEAGLLGFLKATQVQAYATSTALQSTSIQSSLSQILGKPVVVASASSYGAIGARIGTAVGGGVLFGLALSGLTMLIENYLQNEEQRKAAAEAGEDLGKQFAARFKAQLEGLTQVKEFDATNAKSIAANLLKEQSVGETSKDWMSRATDWMGITQSKGVLFGEFQQLLNQFAVEKDQYAGERVKAKLYASGIPSPQVLDEYLKQAHEKLLAAGRGDLYGPLEKLARETFPQFESELDKLRAVGPASEGAARGLSLFEMRLTNFRPPNWFTPPEGPPSIFPKPQPKGFFKTGEFNLNRFEPKLDVGGDIERDGLYYGHKGERVLPAKVVKGMRGESSQGEQINLHGGVNLHIHPPAGSAMANDPEAFGKYALNYVTHHLRRQREKR